jgi:predicted dehydrogenase
MLLGAISATRIPLNLRMGPWSALNFIMVPSERHILRSTVIVKIWRFIDIFGEKGTVKIGGQYLNAIEYEMVRDLEIGNVPAGNKSNDYGTYQGSMSNHDKIYQHVRDVLTIGAPNQFSGQDALKTVEIIERIYAAAGRHQDA